MLGCCKGACARRAVAGRRRDRPRKLRWPWRRESLAAGSRECGLAGGAWARSVRARRCGTRELARAGHRRRQQSAAWRRPHALTERAWASIGASIRSTWCHPAMLAAAARAQGLRQLLALPAAAGAAQAACAQLQQHQQERGIRLFEVRRCRCWVELAAAAASAACRPIARSPTAPAASACCPRRRSSARRTGPSARRRSRRARAVFAVGAAAACMHGQPIHGTNVRSSSHPNPSLPAALMTTALQEEMQRGYFDDFRDFRDSKGKVFMAPERLAPARHVRTPVLLASSPACLWSCLLVPTCACLRHGLC